MFFLFLLFIQHEYLRVCKRMHIDIQKLRFTKLQLSPAGTNIVISFRKVYFATVSIFLDHLLKNMMTQVRFSIQLVHASFTIKPACCLPCKSIAKGLFFYVQFLRAVSIQAIKSHFFIYRSYVIHAKLYEHGNEVFMSISQHKGYHWENKRNISFCL